MALQCATLIAAAIVKLTGNGLSEPLSGVAFQAAVVLSVVASAAILGLYDHTLIGTIDRLRLRIYVAATLLWAGAALLAPIQPVRATTIQMLGITAAIYVIFAALTEAAVRSLVFRWLDWRVHVLVLGSGALAQRTVQELHARPALGLRPIGYCGEAAQDGTLRQLPCFGPIRDAAKLGPVADLALVAFSGEQPVVVPADLPFDCILVLPGSESLPIKGKRSRALGWATNLHSVDTRHAPRYELVKRSIDLLVSVPLLLLSLPVILICGLAIWSISRGPIFYTQRRIGWHGRSVKIFKLRSMWPDAAARLETVLRNNPQARQEWQKYVKLSSDPRILPVIGSFIRRTSIDELPQLWNVIKGEISLVGPRPFPAYHVERFSPEFQELRSSVRPGLTGLWQVTVRNSADLRQQQLIDTLYIRNQSLWLDLYIMLLTLPAVLSTRGAK